MQRRTAVSLKANRKRISRRRMHHADEVTPSSTAVQTVIARKHKAETGEQARLPREERQGRVDQAAQILGNGQLQKQMLVPALQAAPQPATAKAAVAATVPAISEADKAEFALLNKKIADADVEAYVKHRNQFFGSTEAYLQYAAIADAELDSTKGLRKLVELRGQPAAQTILYRWLRKAYQDKAGVSDVPGLIKQGMSPALQAAMAKVKDAYGQTFRYGGFNPRPKKNAKYKFRLGTVSEHGLGKAVDIEAKKNPILSKADWHFIETLTGKRVDRKKERWQKQPEALWQDVADLNQRFVQKLKDEVARVEKERAADLLANGKPKPAKEPKEPLAEILGKHKALQKYKDGFFTLEWKLVQALHENGFTWGATFGNAVDLHHFEL